MKQFIFLLITFVFYCCNKIEQGKTKKLTSMSTEWTEEGLRTPPRSAKVQVLYH